MAGKTVRCVCKRLVECDGFTNTCECGRDYNWAGQELAPRSQWGEETGESLADILSIDGDIAAGRDLLDEGGW